MRGRSFTRLVGLLGLLAGMGALALAAPAQAKIIRKPLGPFGSSSQPSFSSVSSNSKLGLAVDQGTHELYVVSGGVELQSLKVSATAGTYRLKFEGETTADISFEAPNGEKPGSVQSALEALPAIGPGNVFVSEGPGDATGSRPYEVEFRGALANTDLEQLTCENGQRRSQVAAAAASRRSQTANPNSSPAGTPTAPPPPSPPSAQTRSTARAPVKTRRPRTTSKATNTSRSTNLAVPPTATSTSPGGERTSSTPSLQAVNTSVS